MLDLREQYEVIKEEVHEAIANVMESTKFILGDYVEKLEKQIALYCETTFGVGVASGSDALHISLLACGIKEGDEVITTPFTFFATAGAIARVGAKAVFVDIDPRTLNIDASKIEEKITEKTKAIIPVHLYGQLCEMDKIMEISKKYNLIVIEDAAQAIGAKRNGKPAGSWGHFGCISFFPTKNLGAYGDGGMIVTKNEDWANASKVLRVHGSKPKYYHHVLGYNSRLDELQAAILTVKFKYLNDWNEKRKQKAKLYNELLSQLNVPFMQFPYVDEGNDHVFHQYTIRVSKRDELQQFLKDRGIQTMVYYPLPLHLQPVFREWGYKEGDFPVSEQAAREVLSLPMYPELTEEQQAYVVEMIRAFYFCMG